MYEEYYGFVEKPFSLTPDPKFLYRSQSHSSALDLLQYAIRRREGFVVVTGDIGTGKTTLCRALLEQTDRKTFSALVLNPFLSEEDLLKLVLQDFGVISREEVRSGRMSRVSKQDLIQTLNEFLLSLLPLRASALLIFDEAQNLPSNVLEQIRILSNLETDKEKLLQIVLVGQLNLKTVLRAPEMRQLNQRVSVRLELKPLGRDEVAEYVAHRLLIAGGSSAVAFTPRALDSIHRLSGGIPRLINLLCDRSLLGAYASRTNRVTPDLVRTAGLALELDPPRAWSFRRLRHRMSVAVAGTAAAIFLGAVGLGMAYHRHAANPRPAAPPTAPLTLAAEEAALQPPATPVTPFPTGTSTSDRLEVGMVMRSSTARSLEPVALDNLEPVPDQGHEAGALAILIGSFAVGDQRALDLSGELLARGYRVYQVEEESQEHGRRQRLLVGRYTDAARAFAEVERLRLIPQFRDARLTVARAGQEFNQ